MPQKAPLEFEKVLKYFEWTSHPFVQHVKIHFQPELQPKNLATHTPVNIRKIYVTVCNSVIHMRVGTFIGNANSRRSWKGWRDVYKPKKSEIVWKIFKYVGYFDMFYICFRRIHLCAGGRICADLEIFEEWKVNTCFEYTIDFFVSRHFQSWRGLLSNKQTLPGLGTINLLLLLIFLIALSKLNLATNEQYKMSLDSIRSAQNSLTFFKGNFMIFSYKILLMFLLYHGSRKFESFWKLFFGKRNFRW